MICHTFCQYKNSSYYLILQITKTLVCVFCAIGILFSLLRRVVVNIMCEGGLVAEGEGGGEGGGAIGADAQKEIAGFGLTDVGRGDLRVR